MGDKGTFQYLLHTCFGSDSEPFVHKSNLVGFSCVVLAAPAPWILLHGDNFTAVFCLLVASCSIMADYVAINSCWDEIDRIVACSYIFWLVYLCLLNNGPVFTALAILFFALLPFQYSRLSRSKAQWRFRHSLWHLFGGITQVVVLYRVYNPT
uniref:Uncharacterized protein n=2 Tax=Tetraselmis sp. GSL018 TaxID=582737 RepID=A0A061SF38_9CHLO